MCVIEIFWRCEVAFVNVTTEDDGEGTLIVCRYNSIAIAYVAELGRVQVLVLVLARKYLYLYLYLKVGTCTRAKVLVLVLVLKNSTCT